jgi:hypothetical protein
VVETMRGAIDEHRAAIEDQPPLFDRRLQRMEGR